MEDLKNKKLIKVMWVPGERIFWDIKIESPYDDMVLYFKLNNLINIENWAKEYKKAYDVWLDQDFGDIYNIKYQININMINALLRLNRTLNDKVVFFWFDVDRTFNENYVWEYCPLSGKPLIILNNEYTQINSLISPDYPLIFPSLPNASISKDN